jgi:hypothetical protein
MNADIAHYAWFGAGLLVLTSLTVAPVFAGSRCGHSAGRSCS